MSQPVESPALSGAKIIDREVDDTPIKTQVSLTVTIPLATRRVELDEYLAQLYSKTAAESGFRHHPTPNSVWVFVYYEDTDTKRCPSCWVARVAKAAVEPSPTFENNIVEADDLEEALARTLGEIELDGSTVRRTFAVDDSFLVDRNSSMAEIRAALWSSLFIGAEVVFPRFGQVEKIVLAGSHKGREVVKLELSRDMYRDLDYHERLHAYADKEEALLEQRASGKLTEKAHAKLETEAKLEFYAELLSSLPAEAHQVAKGYAP